MKSFFVLLLVLTCAISSAAQTPITVPATGEYRAAAGESAETAKQLALAEARRNVLREAASRLQGTSEVKALSLKPTQVEALLPAVVEFAQESTRAEGTTHRASLAITLTVPQVALRLKQLRNDQAATAAMMDAWKQSEDSYRQLEQLRGSNGTKAKEQELLLARIDVNRTLANVYAALAKTEESPASARIASEKELPRAQQLAETALTKGLGFPETHIAKGDVLMADDEPEQAEAAYRKGLGLTPASVSAHIKLAEALRVQDKIPDAIAELREALRIDPNSPGAHTDLGFILGSEQNDGAGAIAEYKEAIRIDRDFIEAHNHLAIALARSGKIPDSVTEFRELVRIDPDSVLGYYNLGIALADMDLDDESAEAFRQAVRINPNHYNARFNLGELFRLEGKYDEAVKQFKEYIRLAPNNPNSQRNLRRAREFVQTHENPQ
jgi:tetratricopeptide (TPR) repeat protein